MYDQSLVLDIIKQRTFIAEFYIVQRQKDIPKQPSFTVKKQRTAYFLPRRKQFFTNRIFEDEIMNVHFFFENSVCSAWGSLL